uniref:Uncharacterized protein n=1 Tax=Anguilla anguilla TaxID=7936 RepID=A0A0E9VIX9_ANGAN
MDCLLAFSDSRGHH